MTTDPHAAPRQGVALPTLERVRGLAWNSEQAKRRGIFGFDSRDIRSRSFNLIRSQLLKSYRAKGWRRFGVVSATPGVGKSFIATNLAAALSRTPELQTYLFDLDLRRGSVSRNFGYPLDTGIRHFLQGEARSLEEVAFRLQDERLIVVPSDCSNAHSAEVLSTARMRELVGAMRDSAQNCLVICDLPPVFANDDASIVMADLDAYILVVEDGQTTKRQITETVGLLGRARCAGVVLNHFDGGLIRDTMGYTYGSGKAYGEYFS